jgi:hypothetical protein
MGVLGRAGEVVHVGRQHEQGGVEPGGRKTPAQPLETRLELGEGRGLGHGIGGHESRS